MFNIYGCYVSLVFLQFILNFMVSYTMQYALWFDLFRLNAKKKKTKMISCFVAHQPRVMQNRDEKKLLFTI